MYQKLSNMLRIKYLVLACLLMVGCGFEPVYQPRTMAKTPQVFKLAISGNNDNAYTSYKLRRELEMWLPTISQKVPHSLKVEIKLEEAYGDIAFSASAKVLRSQGHLTAHVLVFDNRSTPIHKATLDVVSSYTVDSSEEFPTMAAESGARERLIRNLAQDITHELSLMNVPEHVSDEKVQGSIVDVDNRA